MTADNMVDQNADVILLGGKVHTLDATGTVATAVAVSKGKILAVGSDDQVIRFADPTTRRMNLAGAVVLPGLIDSHIHVTDVGKVSDMAFLYDVRSVAEILDRLKQQANTTSGAVGGRGGNFHETSLAEGRLPTAADLDRVATDRPVMITDVNKTIVNTFALRNINTSTIPLGGEVPTDASGKPLGIFLYAAKGMTPLPGPSSSVADITTEEAIVRGLQAAARMGLTSVLEPSPVLDLESLAAYRTVARDQRLPIRVSVMPPHVTATELKRIGIPIKPLDVKPAELGEIGISPGLKEGLLSFGPIKMAYDSWIMHRTAMMYESYAGQPDNFGSSWISEEELQRKIDEAFDAGWPVGIHTTGDRGVDTVAAAIERGLEKVGQAPGRSHLIHVYWPREKALKIASRHHLAVAAQPAFIRAWGETVRTFVGEKRAVGFTPLRTLLDRGITVGGGADAPITWPDPWLGIYAAVTRETEGGRLLGTEERITVEEALRCYTLGSAAILGQEETCGSIEVGKMADLTIIDRDILAIDLEQIPGTRVLKTIVGGEVAYEAEG